MRGIVADEYAWCYYTIVRNEKPIPWLPIDSRLIPFISFPHVHGMARIFLIVEMTLATIIVIGTMMLVVLRLQ